MNARRLTTLYLYVIFLAAGISATLLGPTLQYLTERFGVALDNGGIFTATHSTGATVSIFLYGLLLDRFNARRVLWSAPALLATGMLLLTVVDALSLALLAVFMFGCGFGGLVVGPTVIVARLYQEKPTPIMNALNMFFGVGAIIGPQVVSFALGQNDFMLAYRIAALGALVALGLVLIISSPAPALTADNPRREPLPWLAMLPFIAMLFIYVGGEVGFGAWIFTQLNKVALVTDTTAALGVSVFWGGLTVGRGVGSIAARRLPPVTLLMLASGTIAGGVALLLTFPTTPQIGIASAFIVGMGCGPIFPTSLAVFSIYYPRSFGTASGIMISIGNFGAVVIPWIQGKVGGGVDGGMSVTLVMGLVMLALAVNIQRQVRRVPVPAA